MTDSDSPYPKSLGTLVDAFAKLPGIGKRSAERLAFYFLKCGKEEAMDFAFAIRDLRKNLRSCSICFNLAEEDLCGICANPARDDSLLCVVEMPRDIISIEKTGAYRGLYHVILGRIAPTEGIEPEQLKIRELLTRIEEGNFEEVILATNPTAEGDITASYLADQIAPLGPKVSRLARGISAGTEIEFAGLANLQSALEGRKELK
ncbi:MAG: recombination mediator RecR [Planctomycetota bacterium]|jgi:recombination protein RecR